MSRFNGLLDAIFLPPRNWVLNKMFENNLITFKEYEEYLKKFVITLLDPDLKFTHNKSYQYCMMCE